MYTFLFLVLAMMHCNNNNNNNNNNNESSLFYSCHDLIYCSCIYSPCLSRSIYSYSVIRVLLAGYLCVLLTFLMLSNASIVARISSKLLRPDVFHRFPLLCLIFMWVRFIIVTMCLSLTALADDYCLVVVLCFWVCSARRTLVVRLKIGRSAFNSVGSRNSGRTKQNLEQESY